QPHRDHPEHLQPPAARDAGLCGRGPSYPATPEDIVMAEQKVEFLKEEEMKGFILALLAGGETLTEEEMLQAVGLAKQVRIAGHCLDLAIKGELAVRVKDGELQYQRIAKSPQPQ